MSRDMMRTRNTEETKDAQPSAPFERKAGGPPVFGRSGKAPAKTGGERPAQSDGAGFGGFRSNNTASRPNEPRPKPDSGAGGAGGFTRNTTERKK